VADLPGAEARRKPLERDSMGPTIPTVALRAALVGAFALLASPSTAAEPAPAHGVAMHGDPKYGPDFKHFDYVNADAPKEGELRLQVTGTTFDSFNPFILRGTPAAGVTLVYESLMTSSLDEPFTEYGLLAESVQMPEDRSWVTFTLRPQARWHDGKPVTAEDVVFSFNILIEKGDPFYRAYYASVDKVEALGERQVKFTFKGGENRELPLIMGQLTVLPKHYWESRKFDEPALEVPLGSGPYRVEAFEPGRSVTLRRVEDYWGQDVPVNVGHYNFDVIRYEYYRDSTIAFEAFKAGAFDVYFERSSKNWAERYDVPQVKDGRIVKETFAEQGTQGMQGYIFNTRREVFKDPRVRQALAYAYDFEWMNKNLSDGALVRTESYFANSDLQSRGLPQGEELEILERFRGRIPDEVFTTEYHPPKTDGTGNIREGLRAALRLFKAAGWELKDGKLVNTQTGQPLTFEILMIGDPASERTLPSLLQNLERMGVEARVRAVDTAQYIQRINNFDYDMITAVFGQSESPGNEQRGFWSTEAADTAGSRNYAGIKDPVVDELIDLIIAAPTRESLVARVHALDRVLLWGHYVIPQFHVPYERIAYWNKLSHPQVTPKYGVNVLTWWFDKQKAAGLKQATN
jgi:microcin C transport system substrate-binding protein